MTYIKVGEVYEDGTYKIKNTITPKAQKLFFSRLDFGLRKALKEHFERTGAIREERKGGFFQ